MYGRNPQTASQQWGFAITKLKSKFQTRVHLPCYRLSWSVAQLYSMSPFLLEHDIKALPEYHVVAPVRVDARGHFLSYVLHHPFTSSRRRRDLDGSEDRVYYRIAHEEKDLFFNLTVNQEFLSKSYIVERRHGNLSHAKIVASSAPPCHLRGTVLQLGTRIGTAALSSCHGLVSAWVLSPLPPDLWHLHLPTHCQWVHRCIQHGPLECVRWAWSWPPNS